jgi:hypothetical protein
MATGRLAAKDAKNALGIGSQQPLTLPFCASLATLREIFLVSCPGFIKGTLNDNFPIKGGNRFLAAIPS